MAVDQENSAVVKTLHYHHHHSVRDGVTVGKREQVIGRSFSKSKGILNEWALLELIETCESIKVEQIRSNPDGQKASLRVFQSRPPIGMPAN